jgi:hypothetical protein
MVGRIAQKTFITYEMVIIQALWTKSEHPT